MQGIFQKENTDKALKYGIYRHLPTYEKIIRNLVSFLFKNIKWVYVNERDITELMKMREDEKNMLTQLEHYKEQLKRITIQEKTQSIVKTRSAKMKQNMELLQRLAPTETSILIEGESGVGKDVCARWIHDNSMRATKPYMKIDCGVLSESLLESELFGYAEGAFTGARKNGKKGLVEEANGGTLFLDEIGELPLNLQTKLLRLIQERVFLAVGSTDEKKVDIRIIAATNKNLKEMVQKKEFREDLYYRLNVIPIRLPPLRERKEDIFAFVQHFLKIYNGKHGYRKKLSPEAVNMLCDYEWPGNVRELSNIMERLVVVTSKSVIEVKDVAMAIPDYHSTRLQGIQPMEKGMRYQDAMDSFEKEYFQYIMKKGLTLKKTANAVGLSESTLKRKLKKYGLRPRD